MKPLADSQEHVRRIFDQMQSAGMGGVVKAIWPDHSWTDLPRYRVLMAITGHSHKHLGQMIAYTHSNNIAHLGSK